MHHAPAFYVNGIKYLQDWDLDEYRPQVKSFLTRRRTVKREVPPKVSVLRDMGAAYQHIYRQ